MHELSLMQGVLDNVRNSAIENGIDRVTVIKLVIGQLTMVHVDSLQFSFEALKYEDMFNQAQLIIETRLAQCLCQTCGNQFIMDDSYIAICPKCNSSSIKVQGGNELQIEYYEGEGRDEG